MCFGLSLWAGSGYRVLAKSPPGLGHSSPSFQEQYLLVTLSHVPLWEWPSARESHLVPVYTPPPMTGPQRDTKAVPLHSISHTAWGLGGGPGCNHITAWLPLHWLCHPHTCGCCTPGSLQSASMQGATSDQLPGIGATTGPAWCGHWV